MIKGPAWALKPPKTVGSASDSFPAFANSGWVGRAWIIGRCYKQSPRSPARREPQQWCRKEVLFVHLRLAPAAHKAISRAELLQLSFSSICKALLITQDTCFSDLLIFVLSWQLSAENTLLAVLSRRVPSCTLAGCSDLPSMVGTLHVDAHRQQQSSGRSCCVQTPMLQRQLQLQSWEMSRSDNPSCSASENPHTGTALGSIGT